jgi:hypothetical protein
VILGMLQSAFSLFSIFSKKNGAAGPATGSGGPYWRD